MDGNRRFAKRFLSGCLKTGYEMGYTVFLQAVHMLYDCGTSEITVYLFSQENKKRKVMEVESILNVIHTGLLRLEREIDLLNELGISIEAIGNWEDLPYPGLTKALARLMIKTKQNDKFKLNMAMGYSGRQEIVASAQTIVRALEDKLILPEDVNETLVQSILTLKGTNPVDLLIRTSGDTRLSDFLLWTTNDNACLEFIDVSWPEFKLNHFIKCVFSYQKQMLLSKSKIPSSNPSNNRVSAFLEQFKKKKWENVRALCNI